MKKVYYLDFDFDHAPNSIAEMELEDFFWENFGRMGFIKTRKEAKANMLDLYHEIKANGLWKKLRDEKSNNTITLDLIKGEVDDDYDIYSEDALIWQIDNHYVVEGRYILGRY